MIASKRQQLILEHLDKHPLVITQDFCKLTNASISTIRRDINALHERGMLIKTHGGAKRVSKAAVNNRINQYNEIDPYHKKKEEIARTAATLVTEGDIIIAHIR